MCSDNLDGTTFKYVCVNFPNLTILTKIVTPGNIHVTFFHTSVGNKYLVETVTASTLAGYLEYLAVVSINAKRAFANTGEKIHLPAMEVLLRSTIGYLTHLNKLRDWVLLNAALLAPFLVESVILYGETSDT